MGRDSTKSVVNSFGRSREHPNLYIADSSVFVTSAMSNATLTIATLPLRMAAQIAEIL